jgi:hypothetical protein
MLYTINYRQKGIGKFLAAFDSTEGEDALLSKFECCGLTYTIRMIDGLKWQKIY